MCDGLVTVARGVLIDHGRAGAGMAKPGHQFPEGRAGGGGHGAADVPQVVEVDAGSVGSGAGLDPDAEEVVPAQRRALGADEDQALRPGLGVVLQMPAEFGYQLGGDGNGTPTGAGFWCIRLQPAAVELGCRPGDPDLACIEVETVTAQCNEFAPAQARVGCQEHEHPIPGRYGVSDAVDDGKRDDLPFG